MFLAFPIHTFFHLAAITIFGDLDRMEGPAEVAQKFTWIGDQQNEGGRRPPIWSIPKMIHPLLNFGIWFLCNTIGFIFIEFINFYYKIPFFAVIQMARSLHYLWSALWTPGWALNGYVRWFKDENRPTRRIYCNQSLNELVRFIFLP